MRHVHRWILEPCLQSRPNVLNLQEIDGELYTANPKHGVRGECRKCGEKRTFHPFRHDIAAPAGDPMTRMLGALV